MIFVKTKHKNQMKKVIYNPQAPEPVGPYSQAIVAGDFLYISGQVALKDGILQEENIQVETHQVMKNLQTILETAGSNFSEVVKSTIFLKDMNNFQEVNQIYGSYFTQSPPARETVEVSRLPKDAHVEISCIAWLKK